MTGMYNCKNCKKPITGKGKTGLCQSCSKSGKLNPSYGVYTKKPLPKCINCNKQLTRSDAIRCRSCSKKGFLHNNTTHGKCFTQNYCKCGVEITRYATVCLKCLYQRRSKLMKKKWSNPVYKAKVVKKWMKNSLKLPNKPEKELIKLLNHHLPKEYKYVGDGQVILKGFNPDFINVNGQKKIIEHFGLYWHNYKHYIKTGKYLASDRQRLGAYKSFGYKTLIIWQDELQDLPTLMSKIKVFNKNKGVHK